MRAFLFILLLLFLPGIVGAQLKEFDITTVQDNRVPVFRDHPEFAAVIINSSLTNLSFDSNLEIIATMGNAYQGEYILIVRPVRQILTVNASGFQQGRLTLNLTQPRQVVYYRIEPKPEVSTNLIPTVFQILPADAVVTVDGNPVDASRPVPIETGTHMIKIERLGYRTIEKEVLINATQNFVRETMVEIEPVLLTVRTQPAGATVLIDGVPAGVTDRNGTLGMFRLPGTYELGIQLSGHVSETRTITVSETEANSVSVTLMLNTGTLQLTLTPADATVTINQQVQVASRPIDLPPGPHRVLVSKDGYEPFNETIQIQRGQTVARTIELTAHLGGLQLTTTPFDATWTLTRSDGTAAASGTGPKRQTGLLVGTYTLSVQAVGHQPRTETIRIERDRTIETNVVLVESSAPISAPVVAPVVTVPSTGGTIAAGQALKGTFVASTPKLSDGSHYADYTFPGTANTSIDVTMRSAAFDTYLVLGRYAADGSFESIESDDDDGGGTDSRITYAFTDNRMIVIRANTLSEDKTGDYTLTVRRAITAGQTLQDAFTSASPKLDDGSHYADIVIAGMPKQTVEIVLSSSAFDAYLWIGTETNGTFESIETNDDGGGGTDSKITYTFADNRTYIIRANTLSEGQTGTYQIRVSQP
jgi:hypothetical protein